VAAKESVPGVCRQRQCLRPDRDFTSLSGRNIVHSSSRRIVQGGRNGKPMVSVVIVSHNYGHDLDRAVRSVFDQKEPPVEVVILDVGSDDNTWEVAQQIAGG